MFMKLISIRFQNQTHSHLSKLQSTHNTRNTHTHMYAYILCAFESKTTNTYIAKCAYVYVTLQISAGNRFSWTVSMRGFQLCISYKKYEVRKWAILCHLSLNDSGNSERVYLSVGYWNCLLWATSDKNKNQYISQSFEYNN